MNDHIPVSYQIQNKKMIHFGWKRWMYFLASKNVLEKSLEPNCLKTNFTALPFELIILNHIESSLQEGNKIRHWCFVTKYRLNFLFTNFTNFKYIIFLQSQFIYSHHKPLRSNLEKSHHYPNYYLYRIGFSNRTSYQNVWSFLIHILLNNLDPLLGKIKSVGKWKRYVT